MDLTAKVEEEQFRVGTAGGFFSCVRRNNCYNSYSDKSSTNSLDPWYYEYHAKVLTDLAAEPCAAAKT